MAGSQDIWNERWQEKESHDGWRVDSWLEKHRHFFCGRSALDVACGRGRHSLFLAQQGYQVTAIDYSDVALQQLDEAARQQALLIKILRLDLENKPQLPPGQFDLLINFYFLHRPLLPKLLDLVKPGGIIIIRTFSRAGHGEPSRVKPRMRLEPGELLKIFSSWQVLNHEEGVEPSKKGGTLAGVVARKPISI